MIITKNIVNKEDKIGRLLDIIKWRLSAKNPKRIPPPDERWARRIFRDKGLVSTNLVITPSKVLNLGDVKAGSTKEVKITLKNTGQADAWIKVYPPRGCNLKELSNKDLRISNQAKVPAFILE